MGKNKFYAVVKGSRPGIYNEWFGAHGAEASVRGFTGARYKGFASRGEAEAWLAEMSGKAGPAQQRLPGVEKEKAPGHEKSSHESKAARAAHHAKHEATDHGRIMIFTDGGCSRNPGPGGYGVVILHGDTRKELSGGFARTTNNRMELLAVIKGLEAHKDERPVIVYSDSQYVVNGIEKGWAIKWKRNNWMRNAKEKAENSDLWSRLLDLCEKHDVTFRWVRGHDGNRENERCDELAVEMSRREGLPPDEGYAG